MEHTTEQKKTLVLGASDNPERYSHIAVRRLQQAGHPVWPVGKKAGQVGGLTIATSLPTGEDIHTVTLYLNPQAQEAYFEAIKALRPRRVIFNPGTENDIWAHQLQAEGIETLEACTLVMLSTRQY